MTSRVSDPGGSRSRPDDPRLDLSHPLTPGNAVAAIIVVDGRYLLQHRDMKPEIFFPGHWGCFGGGVDPGETPAHAILRELDEELGFKPDHAAVRHFSQFDFSLGFAGLAPIYRIFYEINATAEDVGGLRLGEGSALRLVPAPEILTGAILLTPYDAFALWLHINRSRLVGH